MSETSNSIQRGIFKFNNGFKDIYADPFEIDWALQKASEFEDMKNIDEWLQIPHNEDGSIPDSVPDSDIKLYKEACHRLVPIIRKAFEIAPFNKETGDGLTGEQVLDVYANYILWSIDLKKSIE